MTLLTQRDFESKAGQERIIKTIHKLESELHQLKTTVHQLAQEEKFLERDLQGPEEY